MLSALRLDELLERYFVRAQPLGVALFHPSLDSPLYHGQPARFALRSLGSFYGLAQAHREEEGVSVFGASLESGCTLVAQHSHQAVDAVVTTSWQRFVRLATAVTIELGRRSSPPPESPAAPRFVLRPLRPTSPAPLQAEAPFPPEEPA